MKASNPFARFSAVFEFFGAYLIVAAVSLPALGQEPSPALHGIWTAPSSEPPPLVEEFTAHMLDAGEVKIGTELDVGLWRNVMLGTDLIADLVGAPSLQTKVQVYRTEQHQVSLQLRAALLSRDYLLWGSVKEHFTRLYAQVYRPAVSWSHNVSDRLQLHMFWAKGFGEIEAELSEKGRRALWEQKYPGKNYDNRDLETQEPGDESSSPSNAKNQARTAPENAYLRRSVQVQSIAGLVQDRFQVTGEFRRATGNRVLLTTRVEQTRLVRLEADTIQVSAAHHWVWPHLNMRLGIGVQYFAITGEDLDRQLIDETGFEPAAEIAFYWRLAARSKNP